MQGASFSELASQADSEGNKDATESVSDSRKGGLSDSESVTDSKGVGNCGSHKREGEIGHVIWKSWDGSSNRGKEQCIMGEKGKGICREWGMVHLGKTLVGSYLGRLVGYPSLIRETTM